MTTTELNTLESQITNAYRLFCCNVHLDTEVGQFIYDAAIEKIERLRKEAEPSHPDLIAIERDARGFETI